MRRKSIVLRLSLLALASGLSLAGLFSCGDYSWDDSFVWGPGAVSGSAGGISTGWIGDGSDGWKLQDGAQPMGSELGFSWCNGIFVTENGTVFVADTNNHRISKWSSDGQFQGWIGNGSPGWQSGSFSAAAGLDIWSFNYPTDVWVHGTLIYVADRSNHRICRWGIDGEAHGWIGEGLSGWQSTSSTNYADWTYDAFDSPRGVCTAPNGDIFVADSSNHRISRWTVEGNADGWIGDGNSGWQTTSGANSAGGNYDYFSNPEDVFFDPSTGYVYVADTDNHRISRWDVPSGTAMDWVGWQSNGWSSGIATGSGNNPDAFDGPRSVFVDQNQNIYVADSYNHRISKFDSNATFLGWIGGGSNGWQDTSGTGPSPDFESFNAPAGIHVTSGGNIYVADEQNNRISRWTNAGPLQTQWDTTPPATVNDLNASVSGPDVILDLTAVGDDNLQGTARSYIIKFGFAPITAFNWDTAMFYHPQPVTQSAGNTDYITIQGLAPGMTYFFAIVVVDDATNVSGISNSPSASLP